MDIRDTDKLDDATKRDLDIIRRLGRDREQGTMADEFDKLATELLPCADSGRATCDEGNHESDCPVFYRPAVAQFGRDQHAKGIATFQDQIRERLMRDYKLFDGSIDGAGSDGDAIDFTMAEIAQAIQQIEEREHTKGFAEGIETAAVYHCRWCGEGMPLDDDGFHIDRTGRLWCRGLVMRRDLLPTQEKSE